MNRRPLYIAPDADIPDGADYVPLFVDKAVPEYPDSFANYPAVLGDVRSDRADDGGQTTVRECLLSMLIDLDKGEIEPVQITCVYTRAKGGVGWRSGGKGGATMELGALARVSGNIVKAIDD